MDRHEDRRRAVKTSVETLKHFDPLEVLNDLNENAIYLCKIGIKRRNPHISEKELQRELRRIISETR